MFGNIELAVVKGDNVLHMLSLKPLRARVTRYVIKNWLGFCKDIGCNVVTNPVKWHVTDGLGDRKATRNPMLCADMRMKIPI